MYFNGKITLKKADKKNNQLKTVLELNERARPRVKADKKEKKDAL